MFEFWYDYVKPKHGERAKFYVYNFIVDMKTDDIYKDIAEDFETRLDSPLDSPLPKGKKKTNNWINER